MTSTGPNQLQTFIQNFVVASAHFDTALGKQKVDDLLKKKMTLSLQEMTILIAAVEMIFKETPIPFVTIETTRNNLLTAEAAAARKPKFKNQKANITKQRKTFDKEQEPNLFTAYLRSNVFEAMLTRVLPTVQNLQVYDIRDVRAQILKNLFGHLCPGTISLTERFWSSEIYTENYYDTYQKISEKIQLLINYGDEVQENRIRELNECLKNEGSDSARVTIVLYKLQSLLWTYRQALRFVLIFSQMTQANSLLNKLQILVNELSKHNSRIDQLAKAHDLVPNRNILTNVREDLDKLSTHSVVSDNPWITPFQELERVFKRFQNPDVQRPATNEEDNELLSDLKRVDQTHSGKKKSKDFNDELSACLSSLNCYSTYHENSLSLATIEAMQRLIGKTLASYKSNESNFTDFAQCCIFSLLERIKDVINKQHKRAKTRQVQAPSSSSTTTSTSNISHLVDEFMTLTGHRDINIRNQTEKGAFVEPSFFPIQQLEAEYNKLDDSLNKKQASLEEDDELREKMNGFEKFFLTETSSPLVGIVQNYLTIFRLYTNCDNNSLSYATIETMYRLTLKLWTTLKKHEFTFTDFAQLCDLMDKIKLQIAEHYKVSKTRNQPAVATSSSTSSSSTNEEGAIHDLARQFIECAKNPDTTTSKPQIVQFFETNQEEICTQIHLFMQIVVTLCTTPRTQGEVHQGTISLIDTVHTLHALITLVKGRIDIPEQTQLELLFADKLMILIQQLLKSIEQSKNDPQGALFAAHILEEKLDWMDEYYGMWWQNVACQKVSADTFSSLVDFFDKAGEFRWKFSSQQAALSFTNKGIGFCQAVTPFLGQNRTLKNNMSALNTKLLAFKNEATTYEKKTWNALLSDIFIYYNHPEDIKLHYRNYDLPTQRQKANQLSAKVNAKRTTINLDDIRTWTNELLGLSLAIDQYEAATTSNDYHRLRDVTSAILRLLSSIPEFQFDKVVSSKKKNQLKAEFHTVNALTKRALEQLCHTLNGYADRRPAEAETKQPEEVVHLLSEELEDLRLDEKPFPPAPPQTPEKVKDEAIVKQENAQAAEFKKIVDLHERAKEKMAKQYAKQLKKEQAKLAEQFEKEKLNAQKIHAKHLQAMKDQYEQDMRNTTEEHQQYLQLLQLELAHEIADLKDEHLLAKETLLSAQQDELDEHEENADKTVLPMKALLQSRENDLGFRLQQDPSRILFMLHDCVERQSGLSSIEYDVIMANRHLITKLEIGRYQHHVYQLLICPHNIEQFKKLMASDLLCSIFPGLGLTQKAFETIPAMQGFVEWKLSEYAVNPDAVDFEHVLSLFIVASMIMQPSEDRSIKNQCVYMLERFFAAYQHFISEDDKSDMRDTVMARMFDGTGSDLYAEYLYYESSWFAAHVDFYHDYVNAQLRAYKQFCDQSLIATNATVASARRMKIGPT